MDDLVLARDPAAEAAAAVGDGNDRTKGTDYHRDDEMVPVVHPV